MVLKIDLSRNKNVKTMLHEANSLATCKAIWVLAKMDDIAVAV